MISVIKSNIYLPYRMICPLCGCIIDFDDSEIKEIHDNFGDYYEIACPECNHWDHVWNKKEYLK